MRLALATQTTFAIALLGYFLLPGCATINLDERRTASSHIAIDAGWQRLNLAADPFVLAAFIPPNPAKVDILSIYIEGDGLAWINSSTPSFDPTPLDPVALRLALRHPGPAVYLARPCQYIAKKDRHSCENKYWTKSRFAPEVIEASSNAIAQLKQRFGAKKIELIGYSGGGAIAALVATRRNDVNKLITVAGNLDHATWTHIHHISPLSGSLNPADEWQLLVDVPQVHFIGGQDDNISREIATSYLTRYPEAKRPKLSIIESFNHNCCWVENWPALYATAF